ncbi:MAG: T9SS type B sorting domain-containing protein, partial [Paludibacteraceae bacterium]|nr:T9SS type B sorting domain-containing protein [Paludibacteraceae bacterium]
GDKLCVDRTNIPAISATANAGEAIDWYDAATGGNLLQAGSTTYQPTAAGTYYAEARELTSGCVSVRTAVTVTVTPVISLGNDRTVCPGDQVQLTVETNDADLTTYTWEGATGNGANATLDAPACRQSADVRVTVFNGDNCSSVASLTISAGDTENPTISLIQGATAQQAAIPAGSCQYTIPDLTNLVEVGDNCTSNNNLQITQNPAAGTPANPTQTVTVTVTDGCDNTGTLNFTVTTPADLPAVTIDGQATTCPGGDVELTAVTNAVDVQYEWNNATALPTAANKATLTAGARCGDQVTAQVTIRNANGCTSTSDWFTLTAQDNVNPTIELQAGATLQQNATPAGNCQYTVPDLTGMVVVDDNCTDANDLIVTQQPAAGSAIQQTGNVTVTVTDGCNLTSSLIFSVEIPADLPAITIEGEATTCPGGEVELTAVINYNGQLTYEWEGLDSDTNTGVLDASATCGGTTQARVTARNDNGCPTTSDWFTLKSEDNLPPMVQLQEPVADATSLGDCQFTVPDVTGLVIASDNCTADADLSVTQSVAVGTSISSTTEVTVTVTDQCGNSETAIVSVVVPDAMPELTIYGENEVCPNTDVYLSAVILYDGDIDYTWNNATGRDEDAMLTSPAVCGGTITVQAVAINAYGCVRRAEFTVTSKDEERPVIGRYESEQAAILSDDCYFTMPDLTSMIADVTSDNCSSIYDMEIVQSIAEGTELTRDADVTVTVTDACGNASTATFHITVALSNPDITVSQPEALCGPATIDVANYVSNPGGWTVNYYEDAAMTLPATTTATSQSGEYYVQALDATNGCVSPIYTIGVDIYELTIEVAEPFKIDYGETAEIWVEGVGSQADDYVYDIHLGSDDVAGHMEGNRYVAIEQPIQNSVYSVRVVNGSCVETATIAVEVYREYIPKTSYFTPDGNGENDYWCYSNEDIREGSKVQIFDRHGRCVYETTVGGDCWDGTYKGNPLPSADYWYVVTDSYKDLRYSGHITLKR